VYGAALVLHGSTHLREEDHVRSTFTGVLPVVSAAVMLAASAAPATAIPAFARKYRTTCATCHAPVPRLNAFGERFAANGFEFMPGEAPRDTIGTGDPLLRLQQSVPLAVRLDAYMAALSKPSGGQVAVDQQLPWVVKVLSGGQVADKISYYVYFLASERGEVAGLEDAYVQFTDIGGSGVSVLAGQFQVSDPLFKRELRLEYEDYQPYRVRVGNTRADLTYDRGLMALWSPREGTDVALQMVNGTGLSAADANRQYDRNGFKNVALRLSQDLGPHRLGAFSYFGEEGADDAESRIRVLGPDATIALGSRAELNLQLYRRWDDDPFLGACSPASPCPGGATAPFETTVDAAMAELLFWPQGVAGRWVMAGLWNWIDANAPVVSLRLGEQDEPPGYLERYHTGGLGLHYVLRRNVRLLGEGSWDFERDQARLVTGVSLAF
jgi:mono/diheme cytochrome c family protein